MNNNQLDVIITSSGRDTIFRTLDSFLSNVNYSGTFRFIVNVDLCVKEHISLIKERLNQLNLIRLNINEQPAGFIKSLAFCIRQVETPFYFHLEDDWLFLEKIDLDLIIQLITTHQSINHIRFSKRIIRDYNELFYIRPHFLRKLFRPKKKNVVIDSVNLTQSIGYSTNPNVSRTAHFKKLRYVDFLNLEQQYSLQNLLAFNSRGYYIYNHIGSAPLVEHIG